MARLTRCNICGFPVSSDARVCLNCGFRRKKKRHLVMWLILFFIVLDVVIGMIFIGSMGFLHFLRL